MMKIKKNCHWVQKKCFNAINATEKNLRSLQHIISEKINKNRQRFKIFKYFKDFEFFTSPESAGYLLIVFHIPIIPNIVKFFFVIKRLFFWVLLSVGHYALWFRTVNLASMMCLHQKTHQNGNGIPDSDPTIHVFSKSNWLPW